MTTITTNVWVLCKTIFNCIALLMLAILLSNCARKSPASESPTVQIEISESAININLADARELEKLPNVGHSTARKIVEHREKFGEFRRPEHLLFVSGISDKRFREIRRMVKIR